MAAIASVPPTPNVWVPAALRVLDVPRLLVKLLSVIAVPGPVNVTLLGKAIVKLALA